jgi:RNA methyltransferase, TrmH family
MLSKNEVKYIQSLSHKKRRVEENLFIAEGSKIVLECLKEIPDQIFRLYATDEYIQLHQLALDFSDKVIVTEEEMERISQLQTAQQALVILKTKTLESNITINEGWWLALDGIRDPGNMGTIIRLADWFGLNGIICSADCADIYNSKVVQASMGSIIRVPIVEKNLQQFLNEVKVPLIGAVLSGKEISGFKFPANGILVIGNESTGIRKEISSLLTDKIMIPRFGHAESLNAAIATGIFLWELKRV